MARAGPGSTGVGPDVSELHRGARRLGRHDGRCATGEHDRPQPVGIGIEGLARARPRTPAGPPARR